MVDAGSRMNGRSQNQSNHSKATVSKVQSAEKISDIEPCSESGIVVSIDVDAGSTSTYNT